MTFFLLFQLGFCAIMNRDMYSRDSKLNWTGHVPGTGFVLGTKVYENDDVRKRDDTYSTVTTVQVVKYMDRI